VSRCVASSTGACPGGAGVTKTGEFSNGAFGEFTSGTHNVSYEALYLPVRHVGKLAYRTSWIKAENLCQFEKFHDVDPPLPALHTGDVRLVFAQLFRQLRLRKARQMAPLYQKRDKRLVSR
jgi:hypothetical protein